VWRNRSTAEIEAAGQHEALNWAVLVGAVEELGQRIEVIDYVESFIFASNKCFATFPPSGGRHV
jgi:hypothetical protein